MSMIQNVFMIQLEKLVIIKVMIKIMLTVIY